MAKSVRTGRTALVIDKAVNLEINGSTQRVRMCAERSALPPLLIVQAGPGLPLLHEVAKFRQRLNLERDFQVCYWDQRGCGIGSKKDALSVSLPQQVDDLRAVVQWLRRETAQTVTLFGISLGATIALQAAEHESDAVKAVVAISPDADTAGSDASARSFLHERALREKGSRITDILNRLGEPPYNDPAAFQLRASLLADLGSIEHSKTYSALVKETLFSMIRTYGLSGTANAIRNMSLIQGVLLPQLASLDLIANPPRLAMPVHYLFGAEDALTPANVVSQLPAAIAAQQSSITLVQGAGHMVHFDQPEAVRSACD